MRYWAFDTNICRFERTNKQAVLHSADVVVINDDIDVHIVRGHRPPTRWPSGETLILAGVEFEREQFE